MSRPVITRKYPKYFLDILDELRDHPDRPVVLPCMNKAAAQRLQLDFLSFKNAAFKEQWHFPGAVLYYPDLGTYTTKQVKNDDGTYALEIWDGNWTPQALQIKEVLDKLKAERDPLADS